MLDSGYWILDSGSSSIIKKLLHFYTPSSIKYPVSPAFGNLQPQSQIQLYEIFKDPEITGQ